MSDEHIKTTLIKRYGFQCWGCQDEVSGEKHLVLDHIIPKSDGGSDTIENMALLCPNCNSKRGNRLTLSGLRQTNKVKNHSVNLVEVMRWTRERAWPLSVGAQLELQPEEPPTGSEPEPPCNSLTDQGDDSKIPEFNHAVGGWAETRALLWLRGCKELAVALEDLALIKGFCFGDFTEFHIYMKRDSVANYQSVQKTLNDPDLPRIHRWTPMDGVRTSEGGEGATGEMAWAPLG